MGSSAKNIAFANQIQVGKADYSGCRTQHFGGLCLGINMLIWIILTPRP